MLYLVWDLIRSTLSCGPVRPWQPGNRLPLILLLHLLARFMGTCVEIYCSLHLESFFIVVMLTRKEHTKSRCERISHTGALPANSNPVVSYMYTHLRDGRHVPLNVQTHAHMQTHEYLRIPAEALEARYHSFHRSAGLKRRIIQTRYFVVGGLTLFLPPLTVHTLPITPVHTN